MVQYLIAHYIQRSCGSHVKFNGIAKIIHLSFFDNHGIHLLRLEYSDIGTRKVENVDLSFGIS